MMMLFVVITVAVFLGVTLAREHANNPDRSAAMVLRFRYMLKYTVLTLIAVLSAVALIEKVAP